MKTLAKATLLFLSLSILTLMLVSCGSSDNRNHSNTLTFTNAQGQTVSLLQVIGHGGSTTFTLTNQGLPLTQLSFATSNPNLFSISSNCPNYLVTMQRCQVTLTSSISSTVSETATMTIHALNFSTTIPVESVGPFFSLKPFTNNNLAYYTPNTAGPAYTVILIQNTDPNHSINITSIGTITASSIQPVNRSSTTDDLLYNNYLQCAASAAPGLRTNVLAPAINNTPSTCMILLKATPVNPSTNPVAGTLTLNTADNGINFTVNINLINTTLFYAGTQGTPGAYQYQIANGWQVLNSSGDIGEDHSLVTNQAGNVYAAGDHTVAQYNTVFGWQTYGTSNTPQFVQALAFDNTNTLYAVSGSIALFRSYSPLQNNQAWLNLAGATSNILLFNPTNNSFYASDVIITGVYRYAAGAWSFSSTGLSSHLISALAVASNGTLYAGDTSGGIFQSTNNGNSWTQESFNVGARVNALASVDATQVYAATDNGVYDNGTLLTDSPSFVTTLLIDNQNNLYAGQTEPFGLSRVEKFTPGTNTWVNLTGSTPDGINALALGSILTSSF